MIYFSDSIISPLTAISVELIKDVSPFIYVMLSVELNLLCMPSTIPFTILSFRATASPKLNLTESTSRWTPNFDDSCFMSLITSADLNKALEGMHPSITQVPPTSLFSMTATDAPSFADNNAAGMPPCPAPMTTKLNLRILPPLSHQTDSKILPNANSFLCKAISYASSIDSVNNSSFFSLSDIHFSAVSFDSKKCM